MTTLRTIQNAVVATFVALLLANHLAALPNAGAADALDLTYVTQDAVAAVVLHPRAVLTDPAMQMLPLEVFSAAGKQQAGIDPADVEQIIAFVETPQGAGPPGVGVIVRLAKPFDRDSLLPALLSDTEKATVDGKTYERAADPFMPSVYLPNNRTIVAAMEPTLKKMITGKPGESPLRKLLAANEATDHVNLFVSIDAVRDMAKAAIATLPPVPRPFGQFVDAIDHISSIEYRLTLNDQMNNSLKLNAIDADAAKELEELIKTGLELGRTAILEQMSKEMPMSDDPVEQAAAKYLHRVMGVVFDSFKPTRDGTQVVVSFSAQSDVATIGVLTALLLPAVQAAREAARRTQSMNNMRQLGLSMLNYEDRYRKFPGQAVLDKDGKKLLSWRVQILPYLDEGALYDQFHLDEPWDSEHNKKLISQMPSVFRNPNRNPDFKTNYLVPVGKGTIFENKETLTFAQMKDGSSNTILIVEANDDQAVIWTKPDDLPYDADQPNTGLGSLRPSGFQAIFADCSGRFISNAIDRDALKALFTAAGGEPISGVD